MGIDSTPEFGHWNAPVNTDNWHFVYVPVPEYEDHEQPRGMQTTYRECVPTLHEWARRGLRLHDGQPVTLPTELSARHTHLSPDFSYLTYGDTKTWAGRVWPSGHQVESLRKGDFVVFYAGLKPTRKRRDNLEYCLIGQMFVRDVKSHRSIGRERWHENAKTRSRRAEYVDSVVLVADPKISGRYSRGVPIGRYRHSMTRETKRPSYRVIGDLLEKWGGLEGADDGFIHRRGNSLPSFADPDEFLKWLSKKDTGALHHSNW